MQSFKKIEQLQGPQVKPAQVVELEHILQSDSPIIFSSSGIQREGTIVVTRAPARLDIMGGIADYCGSHVFELPLNRAVVTACQARDDNILSAITLQIDSQLQHNVKIALDDFYKGGTLKSYSQINAHFNAYSKTSWAGYVLGCCFTLLKEKKADKLPHGAAIIIKSNIPMGAGIASSAAVEVATLAALNQLYNLQLDAKEIARLAQITENRIVGAPCGIMDQVTAASGIKNKILAMQCQPDRIREQVACPDDVRFIGIYAKVPRSTKSGAYIDTRTAAFMGLSILQKELGWKKLASNYLCNISVQEYREHCEHLLPQQMKGSDFLNQYGETVDTATTVDPDKAYRIRNCVQHPIFENERVLQFIAALKDIVKSPKNVHNALKKAGRLMSESHASYRDLVGLSSPEIEGIVNIAKKIGEHGGIYGAKITGGGGGGTVAILGYGDISTALAQILSAYKLAWGLEAETFTDSSHGACELGHITYQLKEREPLTHF